ncbi:MAG TPA: WYL domain-containing protein [Stellaceae bacterium]|nr:WYL domain-containing protein [Stellaceae bacterium]
MTGPVPDPQLLAAIAQRRLIGLRFKEKARVAEPHDYGVRNGHETLFAYQLSPETGWRWFEIARIADLKVLERTFAGGRPAPSGKHHTWDVLFARVGASGEM